MSNYPNGSEWRKWDLHIHAPSIYTCAKNDQFVGTDLINKQDNFIKELKKLKDISVLGITDYFSLEGYKKVIEHQKDLTNIELLIPNIELRLTPETGERKKINIHILPNMDSLTVDDVESFLYKFVFKQGGKDHTCKKDSLIELGKKLDNTLSSEAAFVKGLNEFSITYQKFFELLNEQDDNFKRNILIGVSNNSGDGASGIKDLPGIRNVIYEGVDFIFSSNQSDITYFVGEGVDDVETVIKKFKSLKPCLHGSDYHGSKSGKKICVPDIDRYCWIKADPTFEGLKQVLYEPKSGERVYIGAVRPDQKDSYKVIRKIKFIDSSDFPVEIVFNDNLCSIIGSRSSGKSALLAYIAHSVIPDEVELLTPGPGEGSEFHWNKIKEEYFIEWANGNSNDDSPGRVVYVPQNYLFDKSKDAEEIKEKIKPVLFKTLPDFKSGYNKAKVAVGTLNDEVSEKIEDWFENKDSIASSERALKSLGDKEAIEEERKKTDNKIKRLREDNKLSEKDIENYKVATQNINSLSGRLKTIESELATIGILKKESSYFTGAEVLLTPRPTVLPKDLQEQIAEDISGIKETILIKTSKSVFEYRAALVKEESKTKAELSKVLKDNDVLIKKYEKNTELESLVKTLNGYMATLKSINEIEGDIKKKEDKNKSILKAIKKSIDERAECFHDLEKIMDKADQSALSGIKFGIEIGVPEDRLDDLSNDINLKQNSDFVEKNKVKLEKIRETPGDFLEQVYSGTQKITAHATKKAVCKKALTVNETVLFNAVMEGDKIGGFSESTMTPGKRALFALRLILAESEDTWPLLIDQPEDDLDSRSIYDEVVPFLKEKKKERQIIMVSHNANLVISSDSEQLVIANRHGSDRPNQDNKQFNYLTGSLENSSVLDKKCKDTLKSQGVCEHACSILDGGKTAFENRRNKYNL